MNYNSPKAVSPQGEYIHIVGNVEDYLGAKYGGMRVDGCGEKGGTMVDLPWVEPQPGPFLRIVALPAAWLFGIGGLQIIFHLVGNIVPHECANLQGLTCHRGQDTHQEGGMRRFMLLWYMD